MNLARYAIQIIVQIITFIVIVDAFSSFFLPPENKVRAQLDKLVNPMLNPIRKIIPIVNNIDFSPIILIVLLQVLEYILLRLISL